MQGYKLCEILNIVDEFRKVHKTANTNGMYDKNILDFQSEQMQLEDFQLPYYA